MTLSKAGLVQPQGLTTVERNLLGLAGADIGRLIYNETTNTLQQWDGTAWRDLLVGPTVPGSSITGDINATQLIGGIDGGVY